MRPIAKFSPSARNIASSNFGPWDSVWFRSSACLTATRSAGRRRKKVKSRIVRKHMSVDVARHAFLLFLSLEYWAWAPSLKSNAEKKPRAAPMTAEPTKIMTKSKIIPVQVHPRKVPWCKSERTPIPDGYATRFVVSGQRHSFRLHQSLWKMNGTERWQQRRSEHSHLRFHDAICDPIFSKECNRLSLELATEAPNTTLKRWGSTSQGIGCWT